MNKNLLVVLMSLALFGCGGEESTTDDTSQTHSSSSPSNDSENTGSGNPSSSNETVVFDEVGSIDLRDYIAPAESKTLSYEEYYSEDDEWYSEEIAYQVNSNGWSEISDGYGSSTCELSATKITCIDSEDVQTETPRKVDVGDLVMSGSTYEESDMPGYNSVNDTSFSCVITGFEDEKTFIGQNNQEYTYQDLLVYSCTVKGGVTITSKTNSDDVTFMDFSTVYTSYYAKGIGHVYDGNSEDFTILTSID